MCHYIIAYSTASWELPQSVSNVLGPWILRIGCAVTCQTEHFKENVWQVCGCWICMNMLTVHFKHLQTCWNHLPISVLSVKCVHLLWELRIRAWCVWAIRCRPKLSKLPLTCDMRLLNIHLRLVVIECCGCRWFTSTTNTLLDVAGSLENRNYSKPQPCHLWLVSTLD